MNKVIIRFCLFYIFTIAFSYTLLGKGYFDFHNKAQAIYNRIFELRLNEAKSDIAALKIAEPDNLIVYHLENYVDFFTIYVSGDYKTYQRLVSNRDQRLGKIKAGNANSPYYLFLQAEIRLHWALLRIHFEEYIPAFRDINKAHKLLLQNQKLFPSFLANKKDLGILHAAVGTVPDNFRWALELLTSLEGTIEQGKKEIEYVINQSQRQNFPYLLETKALYTFLLLHLDGRPEAAWGALKNAGLDANKTPLHAFVLANVAMRTGRNEQAINWIQNAPRTDAFFPFPYLDYMLGIAKLRRLDTNGRQHLLKFIATTKGKHFIKESYQKLAWAELLDNNTQGYKTNMQIVLSKGTTSAGGDENAEKEASDGILPNIHLLKARLLFDGGYYSRAHIFLSGFSDNNFPFYVHKIEYNYRLGRILDGLNRDNEAIVQYNKTIAIGRTHKAFYACNSALRAGLIEEQNDNKTAAKSYFNLCLNLNPVDYRTGLHIQAKAGLVRIKQ